MIIKFYDSHIIFLHRRHDEHLFYFFAKGYNKTMKLLFIFSAFSSEYINKYEKRSEEKTDKIDEENFHS
jgi:hypothetical protein